MQLTITVKMDNAAFEEDVVGELLAILSTVERNIYKASAGEGAGMPIFDSNGNVVGSWKIEEPERYYLIPDVSDQVPEWMDGANEVRRKVDDTTVALVLDDSVLPLFGLK